MIEIAVANGVATVLMNRPERRNALDLDALDALAAAWTTLEADEQVRAVILTGAGDKAFSAGADLKDFARPDQRDRIGPVHPAFFPERALSKPLIAAVNGACVAGGCELLLATDIRLAVPHATFGLPEPTLGLFPAGGSAVRAPRRLAWPAAMELLLTGEPIDADRALAIGLIGRIAEKDRLMDEARAVAQRIARNSPDAVRAIKRCAIETDGMTLEQAFERQAAFSAQVHAGGDAAAGIEAFGRKQQPVFGRREDR